MRKIWKILTCPTVAIMGILPMASSLTSCSKMYHNVKHIASYLHEITYDDYREDTEFETIKEAEAFGCSSVRNGNFYGRNYDYIFNDTPEFIVHMKANKAKQRHASLAVCTHFGLRENKLLNNEYDKQLELIPNLTMDGINDAGVICSGNVVSLEADPTITKNHTNPGKPEVHVLFLPRYVIDHADSAQDAVNRIKNDIDVTGDLKGEMYIHIMIADKNDTFIVEFYHLQSSTSHDHFDVVARKVDGDQAVMTNYYCNLQEYPSNFPKNDEKFGNERYAILQEHFDQGSSFSGMQDLMKRVKFSSAYEFMHKATPINQEADGKYHNNEWYSEKIKQSELSDTKTPEEWEIFSQQLDDMKRDYWTRRLLDFRNPPDPAFWITTHNSTYDLENKHLQVIVQEDYTHTYNYYL